MGTFTVLMVLLRVNYLVNSVRLPNFAEELFKETYMSKTKMEKQNQIADDNTINKLQDFIKSKKKQNLVMKKMIQEINKKSKNLSLESGQMFRNTSSQ